MDNLNLPKAKQLVNNLLNKSKHKDFLIGISGGVDSLVLLSIINELKLTYGYNFRAIHINHNFQVIQMKWKGDVSTYVTNMI